MGKRRRTPWSGPCSGKVKHRSRESAETAMASRMESVV